jgi:16S rRNA (uracil1498-N3)-methyltransferase
LATTVELKHLLAQPFEGRKLHFSEAPGAPRIARDAARPAAVLALVGPAGGWEPHESERLLEAGFESVSLGPRILRAETAAIAAVTSLQVLWGDLG